MNTIKNIKNLIFDVYELYDRKHLSRFLYLLILLIAGSFLEIIGISLVPIFISLLIDPTLVFKNLTFLFLRALWVWRQRLVRSKDGHDWLIHKRV